MNGEEVDLTASTFVYELTPGEGAENGIASSKEGAVILTNQNCYLLKADNGVQVEWCTPYESAGQKTAKKVMKRPEEVWHGEVDVRHH